MSIRRMACVAFVIWGTSLSGASAQQSSGLSRFNPFNRGESEEPVRESVGSPSGGSIISDYRDDPVGDAPTEADDDGGFHFPKLSLPKIPKPKLPFVGSEPSPSTRRQPVKPSAWQRMSTGTKSFFNKTADFLNPFDDKENEPAARTSRSGMSRMRGSERDTAKKSGGLTLPTWLGGEEPEEERPQTVNDFLAQPRPSF